MALIKCPECGNTVSERAHACPNCAFPLDEYFAEIEREKRQRERAEQMAAEKRKAEYRRTAYAVKKELPLHNEVFCFDENEKRCAVIGGYLEIKRDAFHKNVIKMALSGDNPIAMHPPEFQNYAEKTVNALNTPLKEAGIDLVMQFARENGVLDDESFSNVMDHDGFYKELLSAYSSVKNEYDLNIMNLGAKYSFDSDVAGTVWQPIEEIYASSVLGLVKAGISATLVNGVAAALTGGRVRRNQKAAEDKFHAAVWLESLLANVKIYGVVDKYIDFYVDAYKKYIMDYLSKYGFLFQMHEFPKKNANFDEFHRFMADERTVNEKKWPELLKMLRSNPGDPFLYIEAMSTICLTEMEYKELLALADYFELIEIITEQLKKIGHPAYELLVDGNADSYQKHYNKVSEIFRKYDGRLFQTVAEKEKYIWEEDAYTKPIESFMNCRNWFEFNTFSSTYGKIKSLPVPSPGKWKTKYDRAVRIGERMSREIEQPFFKSIQNALNKMKAGKKTACLYEPGSIIQKMHEDYKVYVDLKAAIKDDELAVMKIIGTPTVLYITTRAFYVLGNEKNNIISRFTTKEIKRIDYSEASFTKSQSFKILIENGQYIEIFNSNFPKTDIPALSEFVTALKNIVEASPYIKERAIVRICKNTPQDCLTVEAVNKQLDFIASIQYLVGKHHFLKPENVIGKFTFQFLETQNNFLSVAIANNENIGLEFVFLYDGYRIVTDKAVYYSGGYIPSNMKLKRFDYMYREKGKETYRWESPGGLSFEANFLCWKSDYGIRSDLEAIMGIINAAILLREHGKREESEWGKKLSELTMQHKEKLIGKLKKQCSPLTPYIGTDKLQRILEAEKQKQQEAEKKKKKIEEDARKKRQDEYLSHIKQFREKYPDIFDISFSNKFRKGFKSCYENKKKLYNLYEYDYNADNKELLDYLNSMEGEVRGQYILYFDSKTEVLLTDFFLYLGARKIPLSDIQEITGFTALKEPPGLFASKERKIFIHMRQEIIHESRLQRNEDFIMSFNRAMDSLRDASYQTIYDTERMYCSCCGAFDVEKKIIGYCCKKCGNHKKESLFQLSWPAFSPSSWRTYADEQEQLEFCKTLDNAADGIENGKGKNSRASTADPVNGADRKADLTDYIFCVFCGQKIQRKVKFCNFCGEKNSYGESSKKTSEYNAYLVAGAYVLKVSKIYFIPDYGPVVNGTVTFGTVKLGDSITILNPNGSRKGASIIGLESHGNLLNEATPGTEVGIMLRGVEQSDIHMDALIKEGERNNEML